MTTDQPVTLDQFDRLLNTDEVAALDQLPAARTGRGAWGGHLPPYLRPGEQD